MAQDGDLNLFDRAFIQSGSSIPIIETTRSMKPAMDYIAHKAGCKGPKYMECIREKDAKELLEASAEVNLKLYTPFTTIYVPLLDGKLIRRQHYESLKTGKFMKIPLLLSSTIDEGIYN